jgi:hypothetical protein
MVAALRFVSAPRGCVSKMPDGLLAATASQMADAMRKLATAGDRRKTLATIGKTFTEKQCSRQRSVVQMERFLTA